MSTSRLSGRTDIRVCDVTLRDGEQAVDAAFSLPHKVRIAKALTEMGVHQVQVAIAGGDGPQAVRAIKESGVSTPLEVLVPLFTPTWHRDVEEIAAAGADAVQLLMRTSPEVLQQMGVPLERVIPRVVEGVDRAKQAGVPTVTMASSFATQTRTSFLVDVLGAAVSAGADRVGICDTTGIGTPSGIRALTQAIVTSVTVPVAVHCHDDFGLAVANTLAGLEAGATWAEVTVNGLGERAGNTSLAELVMALGVLYSADTGVRTERLVGLAGLVSAFTRRSLPPDQPIVGENAFAQKLDIHVQVAARNPELFEPFDPASVGNRRSIVVGKGSGVFALGAVLAGLGKMLDDAQLTALVRWVRDEAELLGREVRSPELLREVERRGW